MRMLKLKSLLPVKEAVIKEASYQVGERQSTSLRDLTEWVTTYIYDYLADKDMELVKDENGKALYEVSVEVKFKKH